MKYSPTLALEVCQGIESGKRSGASYGRLYGLDEKEICLWLAQYRFYGSSVFDEEPRYSHEERINIVEDKLRNMLTLTQTCVKYKILHRSSLRNWIRQYKDGRLKPMSDKMSNKKKGPNGLNRSEDAATKRIRELEQQLLYARAENAYLKKLQALMRATKSHSTD